MKITRCTQNKTDKNISQLQVQQTKEVEKDVKIGVLWHSTGTYARMMKDQTVQRITYETYLKIRG
jgi:hypothetical protein